MRKYVCEETDDEFTFIGFDCAYRTLGWCVMGYNPSLLITELSRESAPRAQCARNLFHLIGSGVIDVLGGNIETFGCAERAIKLNEAITGLIPAHVVARSVVVIERQPRKRMHGGGVHDANQTIEAQLVYHYSVVQRAHGVYLISAAKKNKISAQILCEEPARTYATRKKQTRNAYTKLLSVYNFDAHSGARVLRHIKADLADACMQIFAAIFLCAKDISRLACRYVQKNSSGSNCVH